VRVTYSLGSNLGDRLAQLRAGAVAVLGDSTRLVATSGIWETEPVGGPEQGAFLNAVLVVELADDADPLAPAQRAEVAAGRRRTVRWGPRTLDVDVLDAGGRTSSDPRLTLPHPRAHERGFVLVPWAEADPEAVLPGAGRVAELAAASSHEGLRRWAEPLLAPA